LQASYRLPVVETGPDGRIFPVEGAPRCPRAALSVALPQAQVDRTKEVGIRIIRVAHEPAEIKAALRDCETERQAWYGS
jgi:hypothetical protein